MKILHIIGDLNSGGAEKLLLETIPLYNQKGINCDLLVFNGTEYPFLKALRDKKCCKIFTLGNGSIYNPLIIIKLISFIKKYDIAHLHLFPAQYWVVLSKLISFSKIKLVITEHNSTNSRMEHPIIKYFDRFFYRFYNTTICITEEIRIKFIEYTKLKSERFILIHNGINLVEINEAKRYSYAEISNELEENDLLLIQVSRFNKQKDQETLIRSLLLLPDTIKLLFVGQGELENRHKLLVKELLLEKRVLFLGQRMDVPRLLKSSHIVVLSTFFEGLSLASIEGLASGKPFIGSNVDGLSNIIKDAGILFTRGDIKQLSSIIQHLLMDKEYYNNVVNNCQKRAKEYDINLMIDSHISLYQSIYKSN